ncbi:hypothetical protein NDU88_003034 [Pleurodeles waltl]|uniref:Uncharacterized protein n=1 Tax=Pleurodeles waltl TaxID=8319 RepID=A0AAV7Q8N8_PLEWA|nr:hypothetical protein NDU88_003034 [Pleurodeles waltl]
MEKRLGPTAHEVSGSRRTDNIKEAPCLLLASTGLREAARTWLNNTSPDLNRPEMGIRSSKGPKGKDDKFALARLAPLGALVVSYAPRNKLCWADWRRFVRLPNCVPERLPRVASIGMLVSARNEIMRALKEVENSMASTEKVEARGEVDSVVLQESRADMQRS